MYLPIFKKDDHELFLIAEGFAADNADDAWKIGIGAIPECVMFGMTFTGKTVDTNDNFTYQEGDMNGLPIGVLVPK